MIYIGRSKRALFESWAHQLECKPIQFRHTTGSGHFHNSLCPTLKVFNATGQPCLFALVVCTIIS